MGFFSSLGKVVDPTGNNFLGLGPKVGRVVAGSITAGAEEFNRPDPFGASRNTVFAKSVGGFATGAASGAATGFVTGGPWGAVFGAVIGGGAGAYAGATGKTKNYTPVGFASNVGIGVASGVAGGGVARAASLVPSGSGALFAPAAIHAADVPIASGAYAGLTPAEVAAGGGNTALGVSTPIAGSTSTFGALSKGVGDIATLGVVSKLLQGNPILGGSQPPGQTGISVTGTGPGTPTSSPARPPAVYPGVPTTLQTVGPGGSGDASMLVPAQTNWLLIAAVAVGGYFILKKSRVF